MRLWLAFPDDGIYWPDEIYQSPEPAHRIVFGFGMLPWEFVEGARNWTLMRRQLMPPDQFATTG